MSKSKKPRRPRWPATGNTMLIATQLAAKPLARHVEQLMGDVAAAATALREGVANAIERQGIVRGLQEHLTSANTALQAIYQRAKLDDGWRPPTLRYDELDAVRAFVDLHAFQLKQLSRAEFMRAIEAAAGTIRSNGGSVTYARQSMEVQS